MWEALLFRAGYNAAMVAAGAGAFGIAAGVVGCFVLLRGRALIADAAAHATLPGLALAFLLALPLGLDPRAPGWLLGWAALTAALGVAAANTLVRSGRIRDDAAIAVALSVAFGLGAVLLSVVQALPVGGQAGLPGLLLGRAAGMTAAEAVAMAAVAGAALLLLLLLRRPLALLLFDPLAARLLVRRLPAMAALAAAFGAMSAHLGVALSAAAPGVPTGATIVLVAVAIFAFALLLSPRRGLIAALRRRAALLAAARAAGAR